jgi:hypothetical protein
MFRLTWLVFVIGAAASVACESGAGQCGDSGVACYCGNKAKGWALNYADGDHVSEDKCRSLGGTVIDEQLPLDGIVGDCFEVSREKGCDKNPTYVFYENYAGGLDGYSTLEAAKTACQAQELDAGFCQSAWVDVAQPK